MLKLILIAILGYFAYTQAQFDYGTNDTFQEAESKIKPASFLPLIERSYPLPYVDWKSKKFLVYGKVISIIDRNPVKRVILQDVNNDEWNLAVDVTIETGFYGDVVKVGDIVKAIATYSHTVNREKEKRHDVPFFNGIYMSPTTLEDYRTYRRENK